MPKIITDAVPNGSAYGEALPDLLANGLRIMFVGTAAGHRSAATGTYYAHPGNRFWRTLHAVGLTPRRLHPKEFRSLIDYGIGLTDIAKRGQGMDHEIAPKLFDVPGFDAKLKTHQPKAIAFTSKKAASVWLRVPTGRIAIGRQDKLQTGGLAAFVLPSPSGAASRYWSIEPWRELAAATADWP